MRRRILGICFFAFLSASAAIAQNRFAAENAANNLTNVSFKDISAKEVVRVLSHNIHLKVQFDESLIARKLNLEVKDITLAKALAITLLTQDWCAKQLPENVVMIIPDTAAARERYAQYPDWSPTQTPKR